VQLTKANVILMFSVHACMCTNYKMMMFAHVALLSPLLSPPDSNHTHEWWEINGFGGFHW